MLEKLAIHLMPTPNELTAANAQTSDFAYLVPTGQEWLTVQEVAAVLGVSDQCVRDCFESGKLCGHRFNGRSVKGQAQRHRLMIRRDSLLLFLAESANYDKQLFLDRFSETLHALPRDWLEDVAKVVEGLERKPSSRRRMSDKVDVKNRV